MYPSQTIQAMAVSPGIAIGRVMRMRSGSRLQEPESVHIDESEVEAEIKRYDAALDVTRQQLKELRSEVKDKLHSAEADIFDAHLLLVDDHALRSEVEAGIRGRRESAESALYAAVEKFGAVFKTMKDEYLRERAADIDDVASRIFDNLADIVRGDIDLDGRRVIIARDLSPSETARLDSKKVLGFAVVTGSATSHTAILARSMQLPALVGLPPELPDQLTAGDKVIVDGYSGKLIVNPDSRTEEAYRLRAEQADKLYGELQREKNLRPETTDGFMVQLAANLESVEQAAEARSSGACGVGLFRTEYLFMNREDFPDEEEQFEVYKQLLVANEDDPVTVRTLDVGGDKLNSTVYRSTERNPFLGLRGIRLCLHERPDIFRTQLRALLRAGVFGNLRVMLPMISSVREVVEVRRIVAELQEELRVEGREFVPHLSLGIMVETPAAAVIAHKFAPLVDFFSLGTNDLVQYTMAIDRGNERVAYLYRLSHPAILELIRRTVEAARANNIWVGVCGQMASDPFMIPLLVGLGVHELSMAPGAVAVVRRVVRSISMYEAERAADAALDCSNASDALAISSELLKQKAPELTGMRQ
ncbi:MAG: phosphoenolpyruvate--protein phosphotransferase [Victivallaceae bacterium]|nr:phosphoenolpyruvate--protein phosphotransferase [Victivallaceae bacterium]